MKLKYVELYGFKSFAEKTKLYFDKDISAIVGPNGSGKSNIADAIKWVLGEQSAKSLRGTSMQDVIFSGSENKKQMNMAQVSLILDNSDKTLPIAFDEVNVTRRVFRTGDSEYLINKSTVRLKEIKELFLDTGIGKDGYSMIGQGRIDEILSGKNEDRREIFEEATGVSKNKYKKQEAEKRLVKNEDNLNELEKELKVKKQEAEILRKQSDNAKEGMKLTSRLEVLELNILKNSIEKASSDLSNNKSRLEYINQELKDHNKDLYNLEDKIGPIKKVIDTKKENLFNINNDISKYKEIVSSSKNRINILEEKLKFFKSDLERLEETIKINKERLEKFESNSLTKKEERLKLESNRKDISNIISINEKKINDLKSDINKLNNDISKYNKELEDKRDLLYNLQVKKDTKDRLDSNNNKIKDEYNKEISILDKSIDEKDKKIEKYNLELEEINNNIDTNTENINGLMNKRQNLLNDIDKLNKEYNLINSNILKYESKIDILEKQYKSYDGFYRSVQNLLKSSNKNDDIKEKIVGVLADLISIDEEYKLALDMALGSSLQNIVVKDDNDGKYLINYIKRNNLGRVTFLPINKIEGKKYSINHPKAIDTLNNLVKNPSHINGIIDHFLSRTILVENIDDAVMVSNDIKGFRVITLDGEIINSWGSMVGGSTFKKESNSLLNRKKQLDKVKIDYKYSKNNLTSVDENINKLKSKLDDLLYNLESFDNSNKEFLTKKAQINNFLHEISVEKNYDIKRRNELNNLIKDIDEDLKDLDFSDINKLNEDLTNLKEKIQINDEEINQKNALLSEIEKDYVKNQSNLDVYIRDLSIIENEFDDITIELEEINKTIKNEKELLEKTKENISSSNEEIDKLNNNIKESNDKLTSLNTEMKKIDGDIKELESNIDTDSIKISDIKESIQDNEKEKYKLEIKIESAENKVNDLKNDYIETYSITHEELEDKIKNIEIVNSSKKDVLDIKKRLSEIGYFNYESIEQYNLISEELEFMKKQYNDLIDSRNDILNMIKNIEKDMRSKFSESFDKINKRFGEIFNIMFNGGDAELRLDSDDLLTAGIEIIARPPGKKLKNLVLLSGGERALTAVALLFAIFEINPAPFCILDEIDAALDEANIKRYINYLNTLTDKSQFIIITHRKTTMEMADILYGVTMEEQGVSKVITLALDDYNE